MMSVQNRIEQASQLREHYGEPHAVAVAIEKDYLDEHHRNFIENAPFICIATSGKDGQPSISPKGDAPGFVTVLNENTLVVPDRPGNNKILSFRNLLENEKLAIIFFVPGVREALRVEGAAQIVTDEATLELGKAQNKLPPSALVVNVTKAYMHCGKAVIRSNVWDEKAKAGAAKISSFAKVIKEQTKTPKSLDDVKALLDHEYTDVLY